MTELLHEQIFRIALELDTLEQRERALTWLVNRACDGNREAAEAELRTVRGTQAGLKAQLDTLK